MAAGLLEEARGLCTGGELGVDCDEEGANGGSGGKDSWVEGGRRVGTFYDDSAAVGGEVSMSRGFFCTVVVEAVLMLMARLL